MHLLRAVIADLDGGVDEDVEKAWLEEAERPYKELKDEKVESVPAEEVFVRTRAKLRVKGAGTLFPTSYSSNLKQCALL
ncbi:MAG: addiction module protein [Gammaproteobacteria bacterium]|nr:addiction module protein [Gammaproteobacteria bacterium]